MVVMPMAINLWLCSVDNRVGSGLLPSEINLLVLLSSHKCNTFDSIFV